CVGAEPAGEAVAARCAEPPQPPPASATPARSAAQQASAARLDVRRRRGLGRATPACALAMSALTVARGAGGRTRRARTRYTPATRRPEGRAMDFQPSERCAEFKERLTAFMDEHVYPAEPAYERQ